MGVIRREDIRAMEKDKVVVAEGFRVGDLVRGVVVSDLLSCLVSSYTIRASRTEGVLRGAAGDSALIPMENGTDKSW